MTGGPIWTGWPDQPWAEALAVRDGRVAAVGPLAKVRAEVGASLQPFDLRGRTVVPGFHDAHCHPLSGGAQQRSCDLEGAQSVAACQGRVRVYMQAHPGPGWVVGKGWSMETFPGGIPGRELLDSVTGPRPAFLVNRDGHSAWVNSAALALAGIDRPGSDPPHGRIERAADGTAQGTLHEAAMELVEALVPRPSDDELAAALGQAQAHLHSLGIVGWQDAMVDPAAERAYLRLAAAGELTARVRLALWWERDRGLEQIEELVRRRSGLAAGGLDASSVKIMLDGVMETFTASLLLPYNDPAEPGPGGARGSGHLFLEPDLAAAAVAELDRQGFQLHFHAIGDRAVRVGLDAVQAARATGGGPGGDRRHHIAHIQLIHPDDLGRFHELGVVANMQPFWACHEPQMDELTVPFLGPERTLQQYPFRSLLDRGAVLAAGSDWPVSTANPLEEMAVAASRAMPLSTRGGHTTYPAFLPGQAIPLASALTAFTAGSAFVNHLESQSGNLAPGKRADLVVLDQDPFRLEVERLPEARVELTMVGGAFVYDRGSA